MNMKMREFVFCELTTGLLFRDGVPYWHGPDSGTPDPDKRAQGPTLRRTTQTSLEAEPAL